MESKHNLQLAIEYIKEEYEKAQSEANLVKVAILKYTILPLLEKRAEEVVTRESFSLNAPQASI